MKASFNNLRRLVIHGHDKGHYVNKLDIQVEFIFQDIKGKLIKPLQANVTRWLIQLIICTDVYSLLNRALNHVQLNKTSNIDKGKTL